MDDEAERERLARALADHDIGRVIGRGQFGVVWSARHIHLSRDVAIKRLDHQISLDAEHSTRFRREARTLAQLDHKHVVAVHDYREVDGMRLLVMELLRGGTLADRRDDMPIETAVAATLAAASGLHHAHAAGVLHRDVKPENLMFDSSGVLKVTDFGLARGDTGETMVEVSRAGTFFGTPAYVAPEQAASALGEGWPPVGPTADEYSLAAILYETISGELTHDRSGGGIALCHRRMSAPAHPLAAVAPEVPEAIARVVDRALATQPSDRFATTEDFAVALATAATASFGTGWLTRADVGIREPGPILEAASAAAPPSPPAPPAPSPPVPPASLAPATSGSVAPVQWPLTQPSGTPDADAPAHSAPTPPTPPSGAGAPPPSPAPGPRPTAAPQRRRGRTAVVAVSVVLVLAVAGLLWVLTTRSDDDGEASATTTPAPTDLPIEQVWAVATGGDVFSSPAVTPDLVVAGSDDGTVRGIDRSSGAERWTTATGGPVKSSPTVADGAAYVGSNDGSVHSFDVATGAKRWETPIGYEVVSSPAVAGGSVVIGSDKLYGLDQATGAQRWAAATDAEIVSSPAVDGDTVVVGSNGGSLYGFALADGAQRWTTPLGSAIRSSPRTISGVAYVGTVGGQLHAVQVADGKVLWTADLGATINSSPLVTEERVAVGTEANRLVAVDRSTGDVEWTWQGIRKVDSSPALGDGWVVVGSNDKAVHVIDWDDGKELGRFTTGGPVVSSPRVDGDMVYVGSNDDRLYALEVGAP